VIGAVQLLVTCTPVLPAWIHFLTGPAWDAPRGDVLIVLGSEESNPGHILAISTYWRCYAAARAWREGSYGQVIVSGGNGVAGSMAEFLVAHGVPASAILPEVQSQTTGENARLSAHLVKQGGFRQPDLVTSDYHMRRAAAAFRKVGLTPHCIPAPDAGKRYNNWLDRWSVFLLLANESVKLAWYSGRGFI